MDEKSNCQQRELLKHGFKQGERLIWCSITNEWKNFHNVEIFPGNKETHK